MEKILPAGMLALPFSEVQRQQLQQVLSERSIAKGEALFRQGERESRIYVLRSGLVKLCYVTQQGKEQIKSFIAEGGMVGSLYSLLNGGEASFSAVAMEPTVVEVMPFALFQQMVEENPQLQRFAVGFFQQLALKKELREYELLCLSASERYQRFLQQQPALLPRIKQAELALYLGITPIALSRLKHRDGIVYE